MSRAFEHVRDDVVRCLRAGDHVIVRGAFRGTAGDFTIERIESTRGVLPYAVETCVRAASEHARVRPFTDERSAFAMTLEGIGDASPSVAIATTTATPAPTVNYVPAGGSMTIGAHPAPVELVRREADALQRCYEQACERDHTISGHIELHLVLDAAGRITRLASRVEGSNDDQTLMELVARCIESHVRLIQFGPQAVAGQETVVPLAFQPGGIPID